MAISSIGSGLDPALGSELAETIKTKLAAALPSGGAESAHKIGPIQDVTTTLWQEVASSDLTKLGSILQPTESREKAQVLDTLLTQAIQNVEKGNIGRAVGYLADYATRDPGRAETLTSKPELEPVRNQLDALLTRMTNVARMSAEDGLAKAGHSAEEFSAKLPTWDTKPEVLVKVAQGLFDAGGYANYSRTSELTRALTSAADSAAVKTSASMPQGVGSHGMQAMGAAQASAAGMTPGLTLPYLVNPYGAQPDFTVSIRPQIGKEEQRRIKALAAQVRQENWEDFKEVMRQLAGQVWSRAPLLVMFLIWFALGLSGGIAVSLIRQFSPDSSLLAISNVGFDAWGIGFLALVGFGFWARIRHVRF